MDVTIYINQGRFWPYSKEIRKNQYIHNESIIPIRLETGACIIIIFISCDKDCFDRSKTPYEKALKESWHNKGLTYKTNIDKPKKKRRNRRLMWYYPPFNFQVNTSTNIGQEFIRIIERNFPEQNPLHKNINKRTVKTCYSCTNNMEAIISNHNTKK